MPDTATLEMPGSQKSTPNWLLIIGAVAGVAGVVLLLRNSGSGTTAAGSSINAALGSLQEEQLNTQGAVSQAGSMINASNNLAEERSLMSLWASNQVVFAASDSAQIQQLRTSGATQDQIDAVVKDMNNRLSNAMSVWRQMGGLFPTDTGGAPVTGPTLNPSFNNMLIGNASPHLLTASTGTF